MKRHILTSAFGVLITLATASVASAQGLTNFPMVGITRGQTLKINLAHWPGQPCSMVKLGFQNSNGVAVGPSETVTLAQGISKSLAYNPTVAWGERVELLPTVVAPANSKCVASVEVISAGETLVLVPGTVGFSPKPVFGMLGLTGRQTVRLNVVNFPPQPCAGTISFKNNNGLPIGTSKQFNLASGHATFLDFPSPENLRTEVRPTVTVTNGNCVASAEVYETAITAIFYPPQPCAPTEPICIEVF